jgi:hypothetical protein
MRTTKAVAGILAVGALAGVACTSPTGSQDAGTLSQDAGTLSAAVSQTGNGAPSGQHFNLNIIGVEKGHTADNSSSNGRRIFVPLGSNGTAACNIFLHEGAFDVTDYNCLDSDRNADFSLPDPATVAGTLGYSVWVRALGGNHKGSATMQTCFTETSSATTWCNAGDLIVPLSKVTPPKFINVSKQLLQVCADIDATEGVNLQLVPIFSSLGTDEFWLYENTGLRLAQVRFYPISTTPIGGPCTRTAH